VKNFPEFGFLHYAVVIDTKKGWYRVRKSRARYFTDDAEWCRIEASSRAMTGLTGTWLDDSGWLPAP
jgi:hypothetical protein